MALPYSRNTTYGTQTPVLSNDMNMLQDAIVALNLLNTSPGSQSFWTRSGKRAIPLWLLPTSGVGDWSWNAAGYMISVASLANGGRVQVPFEIGDRVTGLEARVFGDGAADVEWSLTVYDAAGAATAIASATDTDRAAAWGTFAPSVTAHTMADGESLVLGFDPNASGYRIKHVYLSFTRT